MLHATLLGKCWLPKKYLALVKADGSEDMERASAGRIFSCTGIRSNLLKPGQCGNVLFEERAVLSKQVGAAVVGFEGNLRYHGRRKPCLTRKQAMWYSAEPHGHPALHLPSFVSYIFRRALSCASLIMLSWLVVQHCWDAGSGVEKAWYINHFREGAVEERNERSETLCQVAGGEVCGRQTA